MTTSEGRQSFRLMNQSLGQQPTLGPIPTNLLAPSGVILVISFFLIRVVLHLNFSVFLVVSVWGVSVWWVVVGEKTWKFTNKFVAVPDWNRGHVRYTRCLPHED
jgi:hypothetical protein